MKAGVVLRTATASVLLALVVGAGFAVLLRQIDSLRESGRAVTETRDEFTVADRLEKLVIDLETGVRGFAITGQERFLEPWRAARSAIPGEFGRLAALVDTPDQARRVRDLRRDVHSYIYDYSIPLVGAVRRDRDAGLSVAITAEGKRRVDALREGFRRFRAVERARLNARQQRDDRAAARATTVAAVALGASVVLILLFGAYLTRAIAVPVRGAAAMAGRVAGGDLSVRLPETGIGEVGALERAFNRMASSLGAGRDELRRRADEQAALRRVATLVARDVPSGELFHAVASEAGTLLGADAAAMIRYETEDEADTVSVWAAAGDEQEAWSRWPLEREGVAATIASTGLPVRQEDWSGASGAFAELVRKHGIRSSVASPIVVAGRVWGALFVHSKQHEPLPADTESRLSNFTELVATSIANAQARGDLRRLADEQAALRRVATLVAQAVPNSQVFEAVTREVGLQCDADLARMERFEPDGTVTAIAAWDRSGEAGFAVGTRFALEGTSIAAQVYETGRPARVDTWLGASGPIAREAQGLGIRSSVGCPIVVGARIWGVIAASRRREARFAPNTESRIADFTELVATAVANAEARTDLVASRARLLTAGDDARRRVVRDLHDGAQQRLVHTIITLKLARRAQENGDDEAARKLVGEALDQAEQANAELRELAHGILPAVLARGGLAAGVDALVSRVRVPVRVDVTDARFPPEIEASAYFVVAEALTNVAKHSRARNANVTAWVDDGALHVDVRDDGVGGAHADGSGLLGLHDRVAALGGQLRVESRPGKGTRIAATLPLAL